MDHPFIPGLELSALLFCEAVQPIMASRFPGVSYSAARLGAGSEVLGFDTPQSMDHDWGPRLILFLAEEDCDRLKDPIDRVLSEDLPPSIHGFPTGFHRDAGGTTWMAQGDSSPVHHRVEIHTVRAFFRDYLDVDPDHKLTVADWLTFPQQRLRTVASGRVFADGLGQLGPIRERLREYPHDVWLYMLSAQWQRIAQEEAFVARCGDVGDELGSRLIATRMVDDLMRLGFLMERQYAPYIKWFGTAFAQLDCAGRLIPIFGRVLSATHWKDREKHLSTAYQQVAHMHNVLQITAPLSTQVSQYHERPYLVLHADRFVEAIREVIADERVKALPVHLGSVDQFADTTDVLDHLGRLDQLKALYR
jgi:uncharacterized protein DUF4037